MVRLISVLQIFRVSSFCS